MLALEEMGMQPRSCPQDFALWLSPHCAVINLFFSSFHSHQHTCCDVSLASMSPSYHAVRFPLLQNFKKKFHMCVVSVYLLFFVLFSQAFISVLHENCSLSRSSVTSMSSTPVVNFEFSPSFNYQSYWTIWPVPSETLFEFGFLTSIRSVCCVEGWMCLYLWRLAPPRAWLGVFSFSSVDT